MPEPDVSTLPSNSPDNFFTGLGDFVGKISTNAAKVLQAKNDIERVRFESRLQQQADELNFRLRSQQLAQGLAYSQQPRGTVQPPTVGGIPQQYLVVGGLALLALLVLK